MVSKLSYSVEAPGMPEGQCLCGGQVDYLLGRIKEYGDRCEAAGRALAEGHTTRAWKDREEAWETVQRLLGIGLPQEWRGSEEGSAEMARAPLNRARVAVVKTWGVNELEQEVNDRIRAVEDAGGVVVDIRFEAPSATGRGANYVAMILYTVEE